MLEIDNGYFYNVEPVVDLEHFIELLLVILTERDYLCYFAKNSIRIAELPTDYKKAIEKAMFDNTIYTIQFSQLIDSYLYYEKQSLWEESLAESFKQYLSKNNKRTQYNFYHDTIEVTFTETEISEILEKYDEETQEIMRHLALYIDVPEFERHGELKIKESNRKLERKFIRTRTGDFYNEWTNKKRRKQNN